jgi:HSP20 family protein
MLFQNLASPFDSVSQMGILQERVNRLIDQMQEGRKTEFPPINVWAADQQIVVVAELPGVDADDIDLQICNQTMTLKTKRKFDEPLEGQTIHRQERGRGQFIRSVELPYAIDSDKVSSSLASGILKVVFSRAAVDLPKKITVNAS